MQIPLHIKTTILASLLIFLVMAVTILIFGSIVVERLQNEEKLYSESQAEILSERISDILPLNDYDRVVVLVKIFDTSRKHRGKQDRIRIWNINGTDFEKWIETKDTNSPITLTQDSKIALFNRQEVKIEDKNLGIYVVYVPIILENKVAGVVEYTGTLDTFLILAESYYSVVLWLLLLFIGIAACLVYILAKSIIYRPLKKISIAIQRTKAGEIDVRANIKGQNELAVLASELNRMLDELESYSKEREAQNESLAEKVKEATAEIRTRNEQLESANKEVWQITNRLFEYEKLAAAGQTAAQFAHEVGTPLNLISGHVQLLQRQVQHDESAAKRLEVIGSQIKRIEEIVHAMLDQTGFAAIRFEPVDLNEILKNVVEIVSPKLATDKIEVTFRPAKNLPRIDGNTERLQQVLINLINNADDAMPKGGNLDVAIRSENSNVIVEIADTGSGMDDETQKRIFEPLFTTKERGHGTGLGLVIVKQILTEHNAAIAAESRKDAGTRFLLTFPISKDQKEVANT